MKKTQVLSLRLAVVPLYPVGFLSNVNMNFPVLLCNLEHHFMSIFSQMSFKELFCRHRLRVSSTKNLVKQEKPHNFIDFNIILIFFYIYFKDIVVFLKKIKERDSPFSSPTVLNMQLLFPREGLSYFE